VLAAANSAGEALGVRALVAARPVQVPVVHLLGASDAQSAQLRTALARLGYETICMRPLGSAARCGTSAVVLVDVDDREPCSVWETPGLVRGESAVIALITAGATARVEACVRASIDELVFKPIRLDELDARIAVARWRRSPPSTEPAYPLVERRKSERRRGWLQSFGASPTREGIHIDRRAKQVTVDGRSVFLSPKAFSILELLASEPGSVFSSRQIIARCWPPGASATAEDVQQYVYLLRRRIGRHAVRTVKGFGYAFAARHLAD
jgi:DNA-binding response OmpR family regulator